MAAYDSAAIALGNALCSYYKAEATKMQGIAKIGEVKGNYIVDNGRARPANWAVDMQSYDGRQVYFLPTQNGGACVIGG